MGNFPFLPAASSKIYELWAEKCQKGKWKRKLYNINLARNKGQVEISLHKKKRRRENRLARKFAAAAVRHIAHTPRVHT